MIFLSHEASGKFKDNDNNGDGNGCMLFLYMDIKSGIANTMDLPEKLLPRISSRMGIQRLCFGPYNYQQLQEIISSRLKGINAFEKQAIEFASRKVSVFLFVS